MLWSLDSNNTCKDYHNLLSGIHLVAERVASVLQIMVPLIKRYNPQQVSQHCFPNTDIFSFIEHMMLENEFSPKETFYLNQIDHQEYTPTTVQPKYKIIMSTKCIWKWRLPVADIWLRPGNCLTISIGDPGSQASAPFAFVGLCYYATAGIQLFIP